MPPGNIKEDSNSRTSALAILNRVLDIAANTVLDIQIELFVELQHLINTRAVQAFCAKVRAENELCKEGIQRITEDAPRAIGESDEEWLAGVRKECQRLEDSISAGMRCLTGSNE
jgi:hypothetical protein